MPLMHIIAREPLALVLTSVERKLSKSVICTLKDGRCTSLVPDKQDHANAD